ncbi:MAG: serine/threonine-protein kinase [Planctomycetota bacterium]
MTKTRDFYGPYRLTRLIRSGSSSEVWEAVEEHEQKRYALKILKLSLAKDRSEVGLLKHEYNVGLDLQNSPRIIKIIEYKVANDRPYLVLQLFSELNIKQALRRGPDSLAFMLRKIIEQAGEGLYYMHTRGWLHLDIKPDNFLVSRDGETKLIDFTISEKKKKGLGKLFHRTSLARGTRSYMAPEQIRRKVCDERTDVYAFGCVLFEMATGKPPYTGDTPNDLLNKHLNASIPSPIAFNNNVTKDFANLTKRMMAKSPAARPQSMWDFLKDFRSMEVFVKRPRKPEISVFDNLPGIRGADDMIRKPSASELDSGMEDN